MSHPWALIPALVEAEIISKEDGRSLVMGHQEMHRRIVQEVLFTLPELCKAGLLEQEGMERLHAVVQRYQMRDMPDL